ncbi:hypothetical protein [Micromonospora endolithica]|uniref:Uncharacterized protein n=1 Tax=Micromonospora endolithica TaxID=230091 RepID=A0A3A9ZNU2_9ACTN|nr:hypothetical protein [Micromonospora endolithica]RKN49206.1 hypothetical protein D7223_06775 [Micromonospora endolithica]TWJ23377.1 hypothetical protein JD76_03512 [Micromonospora endolithica]
MARSLRDLFPIRLGPPGVYVACALLATLLWFPVKLYERSDEPLSLVVVRAGTWGAVWGLFAPLTHLMERRRAARSRGAAGSGEAGHAGRGAESADLAEQVRTARRGAWTGIVIGVPLFGGLAVLASGIDWFATAVGFGVVLAVVLAVAGRSLARARRADRRPGQETAVSPSGDAVASPGRDATASREPEEAAATGDATSTGATFETKAEVGGDGR